MLRKAATALASIEEYILSLMLLQMGLSGFLQVVMRYGFNSVITWLDELVHYEVVLLTFFGASLGVKYGVHICVDILKSRAHGFFKDLLDIISNVFVLIYVLIVVYFGMNLVLLMAGRVHYTPTLRIPKNSIYFLVIVGYGLIGVRTLEQLYQSFLKLVKREPGVS
ncbi:MAG: TRAP transporter small permease [Thermodesulfobacteriota bacterium]